jgi:hypothetical protein
MTQDVLKTRTTAEWMQRLEAHDVPCAPALSRSEVIAHPQVVAAGTVVEVDHHAAGRLRQARSPALFDATPSSIRFGAPLLGEHNDEVLAELGYSESTRSELRADKIIGSETLRNKGLKGHVMNSILVVGADRGIANAICRQLDARGDRVIAACLNEGEGFAEGGVDTIGGVDVTSDAAVRKLVEGLRGRSARLDWVLHVAGVLGLDELGKIDYDDMRRQFEINTLGPLRVCEACIPFMGSGLQSWAS